MKVLVVVALLVACVSASSIKDIPIKYTPSFATGRVINGAEAPEHSAKFIVSLSTKAYASHSHICGGTIISERWVLTAAHCVTKTEGMGVIAGLHSRTDVNGETQSRQVDYGKVHESFAGGVGPYDIAILRVSEPFVFNDWVQPALLPAPEQIFLGESHLYGWGQTTWLNFAGATVLQTVTTEIIPYNECEAMVGPDSLLDPSNLCSDHLNKGISACNGDSGGPLVIEHKDGSRTLAGIVSWGYIPCGNGKKPSIYTRVSAYIDWINREIKNN